MVRRKRLVRKQPVSSKLKSLPFDFFLSFNEWRQSIEWDDYANTVALPLGQTLTLVYLILIKITSFYDMSYKKRANPLFQTDLDNYEQIRQRAVSGIQSPIHMKAYRERGSWFRTICNFLLILHLLASSINCFYTLFSFKDYSLLYSKTDKRPNTPSAKKFLLTNEVTDSVVDKVYKFFYNNFGASREQSSEDESFYTEESVSDVNPIEKDIWTLKMWNPSKFSLTLLSTFSPFILLVVRITVKELSMWKLLSLTFTFNMCFHYIIVRRFLVLLQDKQILFLEVLQEYDSKFVKPRTAILKKDMQIDATLGPRAPIGMVVDGDMQAHLQNTKLKVFVTHDIYGNQLNNVPGRNENSSSPNESYSTAFKSVNLEDGYSSDFFLPEDRFMAARKYDRLDTRRNLKWPGYDHESYHSNSLHRTPLNSRGVAAPRTESSRNALFMSSTPQLRKTSIESPSLSYTPLSEKRHSTIHPREGIKNGVSSQRTSPTKRSPFERSPSPRHTSYLSSTYSSRTPSPRRHFNTNRPQWR